MDRSGLMGECLPACWNATNDSTYLLAPGFSGSDSPAPRITRLGGSKKGDTEADHAYVLSRRLQYAPLINSDFDDERGRKIEKI